MRRMHSTLVAVVLVLAAAALATPAEPPWTRDFSKFRPSTNGFAFINHFEGTPLPGALGAFASLGQRAGAPSIFGLCGGMSFAAADYFAAGKPIPSRETIPERGQPLFDYIQQRQLETFGPNMTLAARFGRWMGLPDDGLLGTRMLSAAEFDQVTTAVAEGEPIVLGLVFNRHANNTHARGSVGAPWENHQVLVYTIAPRGADSSTPIELKIYDPNYPKSDGATIHARLTVVGSATVGPWGGLQVPLLGVACERIVPGHRTSPIRGIFVMPYTPKIPPPNLD